MSILNMIFITLAVLIFASQKKKKKNLYLTGINFREFNIEKYFAGI